MSKLSEILLVPGNRPKVIADCGKLVEEEVESKGGLTGLAVKAAFAVVKAVKPGFVPEAIDHMLDDFVSRHGDRLEAGRAEPVHRRSGD